MKLRIPDDFASRIAAQGGDLERRALEALVLEEFRAGRISKGELRRRSASRCSTKLMDF
jgi:hypothetical protein